MSLRPLSAYVRNLTRAHLYFAWFVKIFLRFKQPASFLRHYLLQTSPPDRQVQLRDGTRITLSGHPHDVITLFVIFVREDYGRAECHGTVVDIGANIGTFALHAARGGSRRVVAYEPNGAAFACLEENVRSNGYDKIIRARRLAVSSRARERVWLPAAPSVYNRIATSPADDMEAVETTNLAEILDREAPDGIDLLKLDCEGAEYDILFGAGSLLGRIRQLRMEYHQGRTEELKALLEGSGFRITYFHAENERLGNIWACRH